MELNDIVSKLKVYPLAWSLAGVSLVVAVYLFLTASSVEALDSELQELKREVEALRWNSREGTDLSDDLIQVKELFAELESRLIDRSQIAANNGYFYTLAQGHDVEVVDVNQRDVLPENATPPANDIWTLNTFAVVPFRMVVNGLMTEMLDFFYLLDTSNRVVKIRSFDLKTDGNKEAGYMTMDLTLNVLAKAAK
jgi:Tfp pilus assembly protein PilO